ncbi:fasciculation and elongation protein zeta-2-like [Babylonia areolata]|uniref:fasciculation and elongation protein zeta-2-like n=1 Tax=Babylonia areolata TaxID=304850 RepID=UPI003FD5DD67
MAELRFEAPLASFENEEWNDNEDSHDGSLTRSKLYTNHEDEHLQQPTQAGSEAENFRELCSGSLEDLVNSFDERISNCFCNFEEQAEKIAPVQVRSQEEVMDDCQMWWTITGNYGNILPIDWSKNYTPQPRNKVIHLRDKQDHDYPELYLSDEDLPQDFDMHSLIVATLHHEDEDRVESAEDVIKQIEHMLKDPAAEEHEEEEDSTITEDEQHIKLKAMLDKLPSYTEQELKGLRCSDLQELVVEYRQANKILGEVLASEKALQDELDFDKELKNSFISLLLAIHKKLRDSSMDHKKKKKYRGGPGHPVREAADAEGEEGSSFLTTKIPYFPQDGPPNSEQLQIYIKILEAIGQDSSTVPTLLTDYILKVLCPAH